MTYRAFKEKVFNIIYEYGKGRVSRVFNIFIIALISANFVIVIADTFNSSGNVSNFFHIFEIFSVAIFTVEFILRIWTADLLYPKLGKVKARFKYLFSFYALIDLLAILPFYIGVVLPKDLIALRALRAFRLLRLMKLGRYSNAISITGTVLKSRAKLLLSAIFLISLLMLIMAVAMYHIENAAQPDKFTNAFDSLWWAIATVTTVGYGDITPITVMGKILGALIAFLGIGMIAIPTAIITDGFIKQLTLEDRKEKKAKKENKSSPQTPICPHCAKPLDAISQQESASPEQAKARQSTATNNRRQKSAAKEDNAAPNLQKTECSGPEKHTG